MLKRLARLFVIKTRLEAYLVTYAIAVGSVERGVHYMQNYPGNGGVLLVGLAFAVRMATANEQPSERSMKP